MGSKPAVNINSGTVHHTGGSRDKLDRNARVAYVHDQIVIFCAVWERCRNNFCNDWSRTADLFCARAGRQFNGSNFIESTAKQ